MALGTRLERLVAVWTMLAAASCSGQHLPAPSLPLTPTPDAPFRAEPPPNTPGALLHAPRVTSQELANGLHLIVAEDPQQAMVSVAFVGRDARGARLDADGMTLAKLSLATLLKSAGVAYGVSADSLGEAESSGLITQANASRSGSTIMISALPDEVGHAVDELARVLTATQLDAKSFKLAKAVIAAPRLERERGGAPELQAQATALLYGPDHPASQLPSDTESLLSRISLQHVQAFHARQYGPQHSALVFAGPISPAAARGLAEGKFAAWSPKAPVFPSVTLPTPKPGKRLLRLDPVVRQSDLVVAALPCAPSGSPDRLALDVLATLLGRVFRSELARQLRHDTGTSYAWRAQCLDNPWFGTFYFQLEADQGKGGDALRSALAELERLSREPLSARELEAASMTYLSRWAGASSSSRGIASSLAQGFLANLADDDLTTLEARVRALTPAVLQEVASRYFQGAPIAVVASGQYLDTRGPLAPFGDSAGN